MSTIIDIYGNPISQETLQQPQSSGMVHLYREFADHPIRGLTPVRLHRLMVAAEQGNLLAQAELFADMEERDAHILAEMSKRKRAIHTLEWRIVPPRNPSRQELDDAAWLEEVLADIEGWDDMLIEALDGIGFGYSAIEMEWERYGAEWMPKTFYHRPQGWFQLSLERQDIIHLRDGSGDGQPLQPFGWILHKHRARSGYVARSGLYRTLVWPYLFSHYAITDLAELLEVYGLPMRIGKYPGNAKPEDQRVLMQAVTALGRNGGGIIPRDMEIELQWAQQNSEKLFVTMLDWAERSISKAILGATLTSQTSSSGGGAYALGEVHNEVRKDLLESDARQLGGTLSRDLLWPLLVLNRGGSPDTRRAPRLVFESPDKVDLKAFADALPAIAKMFPVPVSWARKKSLIPEPADGEEVISIAEDQAPAFLNRQRWSGDAALNQKQSAPQDTQDVLVSLLAPEGDQAIQEMVDHIQELVESAGSLEDLRDNLITLLPDMPLDKFASVMQWALAGGDLVGRVEAQEDADG